MQIILMEKVPNLGQLGDVVKVKDGYARNFLIPSGKAKRATKANIDEFAHRREELERAQAQVLAQAQDLANRLEGMMVQITQKAGVDGRLFGSVTNADIADALTSNGFPVSKAVVRVPQGHLKQVGDYEVPIDLHMDVKAIIKVSVLGEG